jgi:hypothetical protein
MLSPPTQKEKSHHRETKRVRWQQSSDLRLLQDRRRVRESRHIRVRALLQCQGLCRRRQGLAKVNPLMVMRREIEHLLTMLWFPKMETLRRLCRHHGLRIVLLHRRARTHKFSFPRPSYGSCTLYQNLSLLFAAIDFGVWLPIHGRLCILLLSLNSLTHTGRSLGLDNMAY